MTANVTTVTVIFAGLLVKRSSNSQMLKMMLANGSVMTSTGWDTLNGSTCKAACCSSVPVTVAAMNAYRGQRVTTPAIPDAVSVWVAVLRNVASSAQVSAAAAAKTAARRIGEPGPARRWPRRTPARRTPTLPPVGKGGHRWARPR